MGTARMGTKNPTTTTGDSRAAYKWNHPTVLGFNGTKGRFSIILVARKLLKIRDPFRKIKKKNMFLKKIVSD